MTIVTDEPEVTEKNELLRYEMLSCECAFFIISTEELSLIVSAYTNTVESIVKKIKPREIFINEFRLGKFMSTSDVIFLFLLRNTNF